MFHNPDFYAYLKAATEEISELLHNVKSGQIAPKAGSVDNIIASEPSFELCVQYLTENPIAGRLKNIQEVEERREEARKMLLIIIKKYLGCPYITFMEVL